MSGYDNSNQAILKKAVSDNPNAPVYWLEVTVGGVKYKASLWRWERKDGSPVLDRNNNTQLKGDIERDTYGEQVQQQGMEQARQAAQPEPQQDQFADSDVPF